MPFRRIGCEVYPRVCGGTPFRRIGCDCILGLSPRVRGNHSGAGGRLVSARSIPACAGEPSRCIVASSSVVVYPRVCGGTWIPGRWPRARRGLSPRVRGNPRRRSARHLGARSIPACAGEPRAHSGTRPSRQVYPRVCGGTETDPSLLALGLGLSPRVRGNPAIGLTRPPSMRSIPACAGEPSAGHRAITGGKVYPRVCGGTDRGQIRVRVECGLSPRVRGNPTRRPYTRHQPRSIPACAGEPGVIDQPIGADRVYPRVCGGTMRMRSGSRMGQGLSPRVRGNPTRDMIRQFRSGSIPACAGEPPARIHRRYQGRVYPRVCGGTGYAIAGAGIDPGLSPRVRGNPP